MAKRTRCFVVGVGMTKFEKPFSKKWDYPEMVREAGQMALSDCHAQYSDVEAAVVSYCYGEPTSGQRAIYELGLTGIPIFNTNNNCSSASSALMLARLLVQSGQYNCVMALGFEKMERGLSRNFPDKTDPIQQHYDHMKTLGGNPGAFNHMNEVTSNVVKLFGYAANEHMKKYGTTTTQFAKISYKNHVHSQHNPYASMQKRLPLDSILKGPHVFEPSITIKMAAPTGDGAAAAIVCNEEFMMRNNLKNNAVEIVAQNMVTDMKSSFSDNFLSLSGYDMSKQAAAQCYNDSGLTPDDVDVIELHDCFSCNELFMYEALGLAKEGCGGKLIDEAKWTRNSRGGELCKMNDRWVVNPSGGLESKGHPIGATGLAQCAELNWQLRNEAGARQVEGARIGLQHNFGIGGAAVVTMYKRFNETQSPSRKPLKSAL